MLNNQTSTVFDKARSKTLRTGVVEMLREAITNGSFLPGTHLKENELAERMSVSRSPVREALRQLEQEGLILSIPNQGCYVKTYNETEIEEIFALRGALENLACEMLIKGKVLGDGDYQEMGGMIDQQRQATEHREYDRLVALDMDFHEYICQKTGYQRLLTMWKSLRSQIQVLFYQRILAYDWVPDTVDRDHHAIIDALRQDDLNLVVQVNKEIYTRVARECVNAFRLHGLVNDQIVKLTFRIQAVDIDRGMNNPVL